MRWGMIFGFGAVALTAALGACGGNVVVDTARPGTGGSTTSSTTSTLSTTSSTSTSVSTSTMPRQTVSNSGVTSSGVPSTSAFVAVSSSGFPSSSAFVASSSGFPSTSVTASSSTVGASSSSGCLFSINACAQMCADALPQGAQAFSNDELNRCGCDKTAPCVVECGNDCSQPFVTTCTPCGFCLAKEIALGTQSSCTVHAALNDCSNDPVCMPFLQCLLACPGGSGG